MVIIALERLIRIFLGMMVPSNQKLRALLQDWGEDSQTFLRHDVPKIVSIIIVSFVLIRLLRLIAGKITTRQTRELPPGLRVQLPLPQP